MKLNLSQRKSLGEYCGNFSIAWLAAGVIGPYISRQSFIGLWKEILTSVFIAGFLLFLMLSLLEEDKRK